MQYALAHTVFYEDDSISYSSTFFNQVIFVYFVIVFIPCVWRVALFLYQTVDLYFREEDLDLETVVQLIFSAIFTVAVLTALCIVCVPGMGAKRHLLIPGQKKVLQEI